MGVFMWMCVCSWCVVWMCVCSWCVVCCVCVCECVCGEREREREMYVCDKCVWRESVCEDKGKDLDVGAAPKGIIRKSERPLKE